VDGPPGHLRLSEPTDPVTLALTGVLPAGLIVGALLAYPLSRLLLQMYHRRIGRSMAQLGGECISAKTLPAGSASRPIHELRLLDANSPAGAERFIHEAAGVLNASWRAAIAYAAAGGAFAAVMTAAWLVATRDDSIPLTKALLLFWTYLWPAVLTINLVAGLRRHHRLLIATYFGAYAVLVFIAMARNPAMQWYELPLYWLLINGPPTLLLAAFLTRRIRAVGPMVLAFTVIAVIGSQVPAIMVSNNQSLLKRVAEAGTVAGLSAGAVFWGMMLAGLIVFAVIGWAVLHWAGSRYRRNRLSDQMVVIDATWLLFAIVHSIGLVFEGWFWIFTGFAAFAVFLAVRSAGFAVLRRSGTAARRRLLLLRVFALGARSERLFDVLQKHWRRAGDIMLIAGPDLVTTTVEPHEFLDFLGGGLSRQFVKDRADLARRLERMGTGMDPDLRYRVNEFFCHADTWQITMRELAARADAVLMDLRSFTPRNQGCLFELGELLNSVDLRRVVFVIDATTDRRFLESSLASLWTGVVAESPNRKASEPAAGLFDLSVRHDERAVRGLFAALAASCAIKL
jgi:hypothetical protein